MPAEKAAEKISIAVKTRKDMLIIARSDCMSVYHNTDEMVWRLNLFADAGADLVYPEMVESYEQLKEIVRRVKAPIVYDILEAGDFIPTIQELEHAGVKGGDDNLAISLLPHMFERRPTAEKCTPPIPQFYSGCHQGGTASGSASTPFPPSPENPTLFLSLHSTHQMSIQRVGVDKRRYLSY